MLRTTLLVGFTFLFLTTVAQDYSWYFNGGGTNQISGYGNEDKIVAITNDSIGNFYLLAQSGSQSMQIADIPLIGYAPVPDNNNQFNLVLASFTSEGEFRWSKVIGGEKNTYGYSLHTDDLGNVNLSGRVYPLQPWNNEPVHFDTDTILPQSWEMNEYKKIMFMAQYDIDGEFQWLRMPEPDTVSHVSFWANNSYPYKTDVDPETGDTYWHCLLREGEFSWEGDDNVITEEGDYILRYNTQGQMVERVKLDMTSGGGNTVSNHGYTYMERDHETGIFYISGTQVSFYDPLIIGGDTISSRMYAAAFSSEGEMIWLIEGQNDIDENPYFGNNQIKDMKLEDEFLYFTGAVADGAEFNGHIFNYSSQTGSSPFIMKIDIDGDMQWAKVAEADINSQSEALAIRGNEVAITGRTGTLYWPESNSTDTITVITNTGYSSFIARFNKNSGNLIDLDSMNASGDASAFTTEIHTSFSGCDYYVGGNYTGMLYLSEQDTILPHGAYPSYFLGKYTLPEEVVDFSISQVEGVDQTFEFSSGNEAVELLWDFGDGSPQVTDSFVTHTFSEPGEYEVCAWPISGCGEQTCETIVVSSINDIAVKDLSIYPNPANDKLNIRGLNQTCRYELLNYSGATVKRGLVDPNSFIETTGLSPGIYLLHLKTMEGRGYMLKVSISGN